MSLQTRAIDLPIVRSGHDRPSLRGPFIGLVVMSFFSGAIWMAIAAGIAHAFGSSMSGSSLIVIGLTVSLLLGVICAPLLLRTNERDY